MKKKVLTVALAASLCLSGCLSISGASGSTTQMDTSEMGEDKIKEKVFHQEKERIDNQLSKLETRNYDIGGSVSESVTILNKTSEGTYVQTEVPINYAKLLSSTDEETGKREVTYGNEKIKSIYLVNATSATPIKTESVYF